MRSYILFYKVYFQSFRILRLVPHTRTHTQSNFKSEKCVYLDSVIVAHIEMSTSLTSTEKITKTKSGIKKNSAIRVHSCHGTRLLTIEDR